MLATLGVEGANDTCPALPIRTKSQALLSSPSPVVPIARPSHRVTEREKSASVRWHAKAHEEPGQGELRSGNRRRGGARFANRLMMSRGSRIFDLRRRHVRT